MAEQLVIIGGNAAGLAAALAARRRRPELRVLVLEAGVDISYGSCGMPYNLADPARAAEDLLVRDPASFRQQGIDVATGHRVLSVDAEHGRLELERRAAGAPAERLELAWDRLVVASGAQPRELGIPGLAPADAPRFKSLDDLRRLKARLTGLARVAVAGAGPLGLELCEALRTLGLRTLLIDPLDLPLAGWPGALRERVREELEQAGVELVLGRRISRAERKSGGWELELVGAEGERVTGREQVDLVIQAAGQRAATDFLGASLCRLASGALPVDLHMRAGHPRIWAAGDCAARPSCVPALAGEDEWPWHPQAREALRGGRVAGWNAAAGDEDRLLPLGPQTIALKCFSLELARCGRLFHCAADATPVATLPEPVVRGLLGLPSVARHSHPAPGSATVRRAEAETSTRGHALPGAGRLRVWLEATAEGRLRGGALLSEGSGAALRINTLAALLPSGGTASELAALDLAYSPPFGPLVDPLILAAERLERSAVS